MSANDPVHIERVRRFADLVATTPLTDAEWADVRVLIDRLIDAHEPTLESPYAAGFRDAADETELHRNSRHPLANGSSPVFPPLGLRVQGNAVSAHMVFGPAYEGPPGLVHGGYLSAAFDMIVSSAASQVAILNVTRWLRVRFLRPSFLGTELCFTATATPARGRLVDVTARLTDPSDRLLARADAQSVALDADRFADRQKGAKSRERDEPAPSVPPEAGT